jgi:hypothetical protein
MRCILLLLVAVMVGVLLVGCGGSAPTADLEEQVAAPTIGLSPAEIVARHAAAGKPVPEFLKGLVAGLDTDMGLSRKLVEQLEVGVPFIRGTAKLGRVNWMEALITDGLTDYTITMKPLVDGELVGDADLYLFGRPLGDDGLPVASIALLDMSLNPDRQDDKITIQVNPEEVGTYLVATVGIAEKSRFRIRLSGGASLLPGTYDLASDHDGDDFTGTGTVVINDDGTATIAVTDEVFGTINDAGGSMVDLDTGAATLYGNAPQGDYDFTYSGTFTVDGDVSGAGTWSGGAKTGTWAATPQAM